MPTTNHPIAGKVSYTVNRDGSITLPPSWVSANIATVHIPQLAGVPTYGGKFSGNVRFYKAAIPQLKAAFAAVEAAGLLSKILFWDGSFVPRLKRGGTTPSNHTFGTALDMNAEWNPFKRKPAAKGTKGSLHEIAAIFKKFGFLWGGDWQNTPDGMHLEVVRILSAAEIAAVQQTLGLTANPAPTVPFKAFFNDVEIKRARYDDATDTLWAPVRETLAAVGIDILKVGNHIADKNRFYAWGKRRES